MNPPEIIIPAYISTTMTLTQLRWLRSHHHIKETIWRYTWVIWRMDSSLDPNFLKENLFIGRLVCSRKRGHVISYGSSDMRCSSIWSHFDPFTSAFKCPKNYRYSNLPLTHNSIKSWAEPIMAVATSPWLAVCQRQLQYIDHYRTSNRLSI